MLVIGLVKSFWLQEKYKLKKQKKYAPKVLLRCPSARRYLSSSLCTVSKYVKLFLRCVPLVYVAVLLTCVHVRNQILMCFHCIYFPDAFSTRDKVHGDFCTTINTFNYI